MRYCTKCGKEIHDDAVLCIYCGCMVNDKPKSQAPAFYDDSVNVGLCILAALIPIFGIIYWALKAKEKPKCAKAVGITGLVAWGVSFLLSIVFSVIFNSMLSVILF